MTITKIEKNGIICAIVNSDELVITDAQSALDVLMTAVMKCPLSRGNKSQDKITCQSEDTWKETGEIIKRT